MVDYLRLVHESSDTDLSETLTACQVRVPNQITVFEQTHVWVRPFVQFQLTCACLHVGVTENEMRRE